MSDLCFSYFHVEDGISLFMCAICDVEFGFLWILNYYASILCALFVFAGLGTGFDFHQSVNLMILSSVEMTFAFHLTFNSFCIDFWVVKFLPELLQTCPA